jgi:hypothetical protein
MKHTYLLGIAAIAVLTLAFAGCDKAPKSADDTVVIKSGDSQQAAVGEAESMTREPGAESEVMAGSTTVSEVILASGEKLPVHPVAKLDQDPKSIEGRVAVQGKVMDVLSDKGVFSLVDCKQMAGCKDGCCPNVNVPISVPPAEYQGSMPAKDKDVIVVGSLKVSNAGYLLTVDEVRDGDTVVMSRKTAATDA